MCNFFKLLFKKKKTKNKEFLVATPVFNYDISDNIIFNDLPPSYTPLIK